MTMVSMILGTGLPPGTSDATIYPGAAGRGDLGWSIDGGTFPKPNPGSEGPGFGHANGYINVGSGAKPDNTQPQLDFYLPAFPLGTVACWQAWRMTAKPWIQPPARTVYSGTFIWTHRVSDTGFDQPYEFFRIMDESAPGGPGPPTTVRRWGLQYQGQVLFDFAGEQPRRLAITGPTGSVIAGYSTWQAPMNTPVKYQYQVDDSITATKVIVHAYTESVFGNEDWVLRQTLTASPTSIAGRQHAYGCFEEQAYTRFTTDGALINLSCTKPTVWDTYNADGNFVGTAAYMNFEVPQVVAVLKGDTSADATTLTIAGLKNVDNTFTSLGRALNYPMRGGLRASRKIKSPEIVGDGGYDIYGLDPDAAGAEIKNQTMQMYYPTTPMPAGGYPCFVWGNTQYFISGTWNSMAETNPEMLENLIQQGYAVCSFAVQNANPAAPGDHGSLFPKIVVQAKQCIKFVKDHKAVAVGGRVNPNKIFVGGHSAGGWISAMAGITRGLVSSNGTNFTLTGNGFVGPDPTVAGILMFNSPIDFTNTRKYDGTHPGYSPPANFYYVGSIQTVTSALLGQNPSATPDLTKLNMGPYVIENHANIPPIRYHSGTNDPVIPMFNGEALQDACTTAGHPFTIKWHTGGIHIEGGFNFNPSFFLWMASILDGSYP